MFVFAISCQKIIQNSTSSGNWTSVKMLWKAPQSYKAGNIKSGTIKFVLIQIKILQWNTKGMYVLVTAVCWKI